MGESRGQWGSRLGFIVAAAGSAVGLGNIWKFPYITGTNGGGLFVLIYLVCIALVGIPIMMAEIMIGRAAQKQPVAAFHTLQGGRSGWAGVGWLGVVTGFIILSYYIVVAGWAMDFTLKAAANFTQPISEAANLEAAEYAVNTSLGDMRQALTDRETDRRMVDFVQSERSGVRPSAWRTWERFDAAVSTAADPQAARAILLKDAETAEAVHRAEEVNARIAQERARVAAEVTREYESWPEERVREEAQAVRRRGVVFERVQKAFGEVATDGWMSSFWAALFMLATIVIVAGGISAGIERACKVMMPALLILIVIMVLYGATTEGFGRATAFIFKPDAHKLRPSGVLEALGHAFFTLSLGMGAMITYGSYQKDKESLLGQSVAIAGFDTVIALLACLMIFPITFAYGQEPSAGPGLVFMSMPLAFAEIGRGGMLLAIMFFSLLTFAALTSSISLLEVVASYFIDERGWTRSRAAWVLGGVIFAFSLPSAFAMSPGFAMKGWEPSYGKNFFDTVDYLASNWMLPLGGLLIAIYAGWIMPGRLRDAELQGVAPAMTKGWLVLIRLVAPLLVIIVLMQKVGLLDADEFFYGLVH